MSSMSAAKICIIHLNQIGDLVFSLPLLKALRDCYPGAVIHSVIKPYLQELLEDSPYVGLLMHRTSGLHAAWTLLRTIRNNRYDLLISLAHSEECLLLAALSGARVKAGFAHAPWDFCLDVKETIEGHNGWYNNAKLLRRLQVPITADSYVGLLHLNYGAAAADLPARYVIISPGASRRRLTKSWEQEKFAELMRILKQKYDVTPVLVGGQENREYNSTIVHLFNAGGTAGPALDLTGKLGLRALCGVMKEAALFVGIDSGIMHLAAALDIPVVGLFGPSDPFYVGPQNKRSVIVRDCSLDCVPCYLKPCDHCSCMRRLSVDRVVEACSQVCNQ